MMYSLLDSMTEQSEASDFSGKDGCFVLIA